MRQACHLSQTLLGLMAEDPLTPLHNPLPLHQATPPSSIHTPFYRLIRASISLFLPPSDILLLPKTPSMYWQLLWGSPWVAMITFTVVVNDAQVNSQLQKNHKCSAGLLDKNGISDGRENELMKREWGHGKGSFFFLADKTPQFVAFANIYGGALSGEPPQNSLFPPFSRTPGRKIQTEDNMSAARVMIETDKRESSRSKYRQASASSPDFASAIFISFLKQKKNFKESDLRTPRKQWLHLKRPSKRPPSAGGQSVLLSGSIECSDV
ncbi:hypothetical protein EVAR_92391_1 [Eumeta japonica]|uniref:Uncharacterized protein n=1 Tax=Eumeta variegata TaxID=151549 RepID=A0A4C1TIT5_EUMVA|nr:hypothetical protein EVAR_92391_1 [Eumeta japonica]